MRLDETCNWILNSVFQWTLYEHINTVNKGFDGNDGI